MTTDNPGRGVLLREEKAYSSHSRHGSKHTHRGNGQHDSRDDKRGRANDDTKHRGERPQESRGQQREHADKDYISKGADREAQKTGTHKSNLRLLVLHPRKASWGPK